MRLKNKFSFLLPLILSISMGLNLVHAFTTSVYTDQFTGVRLNDAKPYPDGTILLSLTYTDPLKEGILAIQLIHPNGSMTTFDLSLRPIITYPLGSNYLFVVHKTADETTYGVVVDWNGEIISRYYDQFMQSIPFH